MMKLNPEQKIHPAPKVFIPIMHPAALRPLWSLFKSGSSLCLYLVHSLVSALFTQRFCNIAATKTFLYTAFVYLH